MGLSAVYWLYSVRMRRQWELAVWNFCATYYNIELMRHVNSALTTVWLSPRHAVDIHLVSSLPGLGLVNSGVYITMGFVGTVHLEAHAAGSHSFTAKTANEIISSTT